MNGILIALGVILLAGIAATFVVGMIKTLLMGTEVFDEFNRAGFTLRAFWLGRVPEPNARSSLHFGESAEITVIGEKIKAEPIRTVSKTIS